MHKRRYVMMMRKARLFAVVLLLILILPSGFPSGSVNFAQAQTSQTDLTSGYEGPVLSKHFQIYWRNKLPEEYNQTFYDPGSRGQELYNRTWIEKQTQRLEQLFDYCDSMLGVRETAGDDWQITVLFDVPSIIKRGDGYSMTAPHALASHFPYYKNGTIWWYDDWDFDFKKDKWEYHSSNYKFVHELTHCLTPQLFHADWVCEAVAYTVSGTYYDGYTGFAFENETMYMLYANPARIPGGLYWALFKGYESNLYRQIYVTGYGGDVITDYLFFKYGIDNLKTFYKLMWRAVEFHNKLERHFGYSLTITEWEYPYSLYCLFSSVNVSSDILKKFGFPTEPITRSDIPLFVPVYDCRDLVEITDSVNQKLAKLSGTINATIPYTIYCGFRLWEFKEKSRQTAYSILDSILNFTYQETSLNQLDQLITEAESLKTAAIIETLILITIAAGICVIIYVKRDKIRRKLRETYSKPSPMLGAELSLN